jgi:hypothetical protein
MKKVIEPKDFDLKRWSDFVNMCKAAYKSLVDIKEVENWSYRSKKCWF